ncbi:MAG: hypothetical protein QXW75_00585 [Thermoplasmatales archaeon]
MMKKVRDALKTEELTQRQIQDLILQMAEKIEGLEAIVNEMAQTERNRKEVPKIAPRMELF